MCVAKATTPSSPDWISLISLHTLVTGPSGSRRIACPRMADRLMFRRPAELAALVHAGEVSARELVEESLARIEALDPQLGAFVQVDAEQALATAEAIGRGDPRPFAGVPIAIK